MRSSLHPLSPLVRRLSLHGKLSAEDEEAVSALPTHLRNLEPHQFVVHEGEKPTHSCVIVSGFAIRSDGEQESDVSELPSFPHARALQALKEAV
jgi:CRP-like cAMP-binding protein